jgi:hypothetical protein
VEIQKGANICPLCKVMYPAPEMAIRSLIAQTLIGDLAWTCADCCTPMTRKDMTAHRQMCDDCIVECPFHVGNVQCHAILRMKDIEAHLTQDHAAHVALMDTLTADAIIPAVTMLCEPSTDHTKFAGAVALDRLARDSVYLAAIVDAGAIPALVATLTGTDDFVKTASTVALGTIAAEDKYSRSIAQAGGIAPIMSLLCEGDTIRSKNGAARALYGLSYCDDIVEEISTVGGGVVVSVLVALLSVPAADIRIIAATLNNLSIHPYNEATLSQRKKFKNRIPPLVGLLSGSDIAAKDHAADALNNFCYCKSNCTTVVQLGAVDKLVDMLRSGGGVNESAAGALRAIAEYGGKSSVVVVDALLEWRV